MTDGVEASARAALDARLDPASTAPVAVAVSGGGDSIALLHLAADWATRHARPLIVLTVDHGLHPESPRWSEFAADAADRLGLPCRILQWTGAKPPSGLPAAARRARHALLAEAAREVGARVILFGHTANDIAESDWMRRQGSTLGRLRSWSPSPVWPEGRGLMLLRPLLAVPRADLRVWLRARVAAWLEDPANADPRFARSRARVALNASERPRPGPPADENRTGPIPLDPLADIERTPGILTLSRRTVLGLDGAAHALLSAALVCASGGEKPPRGLAVAGLLARVANETSFTATLGGARLQTVRDLLFIGRDPGRRPLASLSVAAGQRLVWDGRYEIRSHVSGVIRPAAGALARLSASDRGALDPVPAWARLTLPLLEVDGGVSPAPARALSADRLWAAAGLFQSERDLPSKIPFATLTLSGNRA